MITKMNVKFADRKKPVLKMLDLCAVILLVLMCIYKFLEPLWKDKKIKVETNVFDKEEVFEDCTVQVLTNTVTGETSVGWWRNVNPPMGVNDGNID